MYVTIFLIMNPINQSAFNSATSNKKIATFWSAVCIAIVALVWLITFNIIDNDREDLRKAAMLEASNRARSFAEQAGKNIAHVDQISLMLKYQWQRDGHTPDIADQYKNGMHLKLLSPATIDTRGKVIAARAAVAMGMDIRDLPLFSAHKNSLDKSLLISTVAMGRGSLAGKPVIRFSRRVDKPDGSFGGIVLVSTAVNYLTHFNEFNKLQSGDFISLQFNDGPLLTTRALEGETATRQFFKVIPQYKQASGVQLESGSLFTDGKDRFVAWEQTDDYPLRALATVTLANAQAPYAATEQNYKVIASGLTALLMAAAVLLTMMQQRVAIRKRNIEQVQHTFRLAIDGAREAFYMVLPQLDADGKALDFRVEDCNERAARMSGRVRQELIGKYISQIYTKDDAERMNAFLRHALETGFFETVVRVGKASAHKSGWFQGRAVRSGEGIAVTVRDITKLKAQEATVERMANTDALTLLPNRYWLNEHLPAALERCNIENSKLAILFIDIDDFKKINDSQGHKAGDEVLVAVGKCLRESVREEDSVVRLGGDEFTVVINTLERIDDLERIAQQITQALNNLNSAALKGFKARVSIGASIYPDDALDPSELFQAADLAMYAAKSAGKAQFHRYEAKMAQHSRERIRVEQKLEQAILENQLILHFQPRANATSGVLCSMEALVRWQDPERGMVSPAEFIPIAEESNLILALGDWVALEACAQLHRWRDAGITCKPVSINVSARQLTSASFRLSLIKSMELHQIDHSLLAIELTESTMIGDDATIKHELNELRALGIELQIDDFGTGYSSLSQLQTLDIDVLKIDQSFVQALNTNDEGIALCKAMISIGKTLKIIVVAEGIETQQQLQTLQLLGCDEVQGYLISPPVPAEKMAVMLRAGALFDPELYKLVA
jgi:diguanylate cyclase (GGDEF)-like protein/PAS domain S-box-containing protein